MVKVSDIVEYFSQRVPREIKMDFDNVGLLAGDGGAGVTRVLTALDPSPAVVEEAIELGAQLIISHHPLFFELKAVNNGSTAGRSILRMAGSGVSCLCMHTNLDRVRGGVNDALARALGVTVEGALEEMGRTDRGIEYGMGRYGAIARETPMPEFLGFVKKALNAPGLRYYDAGLPVHRVALCGGTGGEYLEKALELGCDTLVTADIKYHQFLEAKARGLNLIDAGHFCTENVVVPVIAGMVREGFPQLEVIISKAWGPTVAYYL